jgi:purine-cytosine permease-like protein
MGVADSMLVILFFNIIGISIVSFFSAFGPIFGLRQMVLSRFWYGWWGVKLIAIFNVIACKSLGADLWCIMFNTADVDTGIGW